MTEETGMAVHALNAEMEAAGALKFACGLAPFGSIKALRVQADGKVLVTDGPFTETKEHVGGLSIVEAANLEEALKWARRGAAFGGPGTGGEVREIVFYPDPNETVG